MAGQSDAPDDLIAELAKLMAQDAKGDQPAAPQAPMFSVRIPGGESVPESAPAKPTAPAPTPHLDFTPTASPSAPSSPISATPRQEPVLSVPSDEPAPFHFDFDLNSNRRPTAQPAVPPQPTPARVAPQTFTPAPAPSPMAAPRQPTPAAPVVAAPPAPVAAAPIVPVPVAPAPADDHDSIADLIAAELAAGDSYDEPEDAPNEEFSDQRDAEPLYVEPAFERPTEQDRFSVPPVFGLGTRPEPARAPVEPPFTRPVVPAQAARPSMEPSFTRPVVPTQAAPVSQRDTAPVETYPIFAAAPTVAPEPEPVPAALSAGADIGLDPIDEIESLIGRAVRVELDLPTEEAPVEAPERPLASSALRSLATPTLPPEAPVPPQRRRMTGVDETIFAAAEASGAQVGWVGSPEVDRDDTIADAPVRERRARSFRMSRAVMGPVVALGLLLVAGLGLYWVLGMERDTGPAPLLTADSAPVKEVPKVDPTAASQSVVFNEMDGVVPGAEEQLVSRDQADVNEVTQAPTPAVSEEGLANRKVRTLTVRPDGTIVSGDDSVAGSTILPVDRPNVPAVPGAETASPELLASTTPAPTPTPAVVAPAATPAPVVNETPVTPGATVPAVDLAGNPVAGKTTTIPLKRPATFRPQALAAPAAAAPVNAIINNAAATPAAAAAPLANATEVAALGNTAPAYVQLASQRSEAEARQTAGTLVSRFGPIFKGASLEVQRVDLGAKGVFYRVRVPASSLQDANNLCADVKAAGGDCFAM